MSDLPTARQERPNTVAGFNAKRDELPAYRKALHAEIRKVTVDIDHLEAAIHAQRREALRGPPQGQEGIGQAVHPGQAPRGSGAPHKRRDHRSMACDRGLRTDDATRVLIRKRIGAALISLRERGGLPETTARSMVGKGG